MRNVLPNTDSFVLVFKVTHGTDITHKGLLWKFSPINLCCSPYNNFKLYLAQGQHHSLEKARQLGRQLWPNLQLIKFLGVELRI